MTTLSQKEPRSAHLIRGLEGLTGGTGACEKRNFLPLPGIYPRLLSGSGRRLVTILTELSRLCTSVAKQP
jgi:hypothetical protein